MYPRMFLEHNQIRCCLIDIVLVCAGKIFIEWPSRDDNFGESRKPLIGLKADINEEMVVFKMCAGWASAYNWTRSSHYQKGRHTQNDRKISDCKSSVHYFYRLIVATLASFGHKIEMLLLIFLFFLYYLCKISVIHKCIINENRLYCRSGSLT